MNRRDFLFFRTERGTRVVEISCRRLALRDLEWRLTSRDVASGTVEDDFNGEPPAVFDTPSAEQVLTALAREIASDQILRIVDPDWSLPDALRQQVDILVARHRSQGGRVEQAVRM